MCSVRQRLPGFEKLGFVFTHGEQIIESRLQATAFVVALIESDGEHSVISRRISIYGVGVGFG